jgi:predicted cupin superfamily sugar epimerase
MEASDLIRHLDLRPLPLEGGYFREIWRSGLSLDRELLPGEYDGSRSAGTAIYYLLTPDTFSALHRLPGDEVYHFYMGDPVELLLLHPGGESDVVTLGQDLASGMVLQQVIPGGCWQGSRLRAGGRFALMGTTMAPGFDARDLRLGKPEELAAAYGSRETLIRALCRAP